MKKRLILAAILVLLIALTLLRTTKPWGAHADTINNIAQAEGLKTQILEIYQKSVRECDVSYGGQEDCVKTQFALNYRYYVLKDQQSFTGAPGVPGPTSGSESGATPSDGAQGSR